MAGYEKKTKVELIAELERLEAQLSSDHAAHQLAVLQEIETALARETHLEGIYEAVGDKLIEIFGAQTVAFYTADRMTNLMHFPYTNERGVKDSSREPVAINSLYQHVLDHGSTFIKNGGFGEYVKEFVDYEVPWGELPRSVVVVPIIATPERWTSISLQDMDNDNVFTEAEETVYIAMSEEIDVREIGRLPISILLKDVAH